MKKVTIFISICLFVSFSSIVFAQDNQEQKKSEPATKVEAFLAKKGQLIIRDYYRIGMIVDIALESGYVKFDGLVITVPGEVKGIIKGLRITVTQKGKYQKDNCSFLDIEELESLSSAIQFMSSLSQKWETEQKEYTEVEFSTKGYFSTGFFQEGLTQKFFVDSGDIINATCFIPKTELPNMKKIIDDALKLLKEK